MDTRVGIVCLIALIIILLSWIIYAKIRWQEPIETPQQEIIIDTVYLKDTVFVRHDNFIIKHTTDTLSDTIKIPIYKHHFDTVIKEVHVGGILEGWHSSLDSLTIELPPLVPLKDTRKFGVGVQLGVGFNGELTPYVGVGISYNLFKF